LTFSDLVKIVSYKNDILDGELAIFSSYGIIAKLENYKEGRLHGDVITFDDLGHVIKEEKYHEGYEIKLHKQKEDAKAQ
jgi:antitoxin component YwqK of YwqJK toxin-antitoxin module